MAFKKSFIISDQSINTYGFSIITAGIQLDNARKNCPAFYDHKTWETPIGHWGNLRIENNRLLGDLVIEGANDREKEYIRKVENGDIKGASGGFDPITWSDDTTLILPGQTAPTLVACELFEASITPLPGNTNCLALKKDNSLVVLSDNNHHNIIPSLKQKTDMKQIALKLSLAENATEGDIIAAISTLQLNSAHVDAMRLHIQTQATEALKDQAQITLFNDLAKSNFPQALAFLSLHRSQAAAIQDSPVEDHTKVQKDVKISDLVQRGKQQLSKQDSITDDQKNCFDYLQRKNPVELGRIRNEEPVRYKQLVADYAAGKRYTA